MLNSRAVKLIVLAVNLGYKCGGISYKIESGNHHRKKSVSSDSSISSAEPEPEQQLTIRSKTSNKRRLLAIIWMILFNLYPVYLLLRLLHTLQVTKDDPIFQGHKRLHYSIQMGYLSFGYSITTMYQLHNILRWKDIPKLLDTYLQYFNVTLTPKVKHEQWNQKDTSQEKQSSQNIKQFAFPGILAIIVTLQNLLLLLKHPERHHFLTSLLDDPHKAPAALRLAIIFVQVYIWSYFWIWSMLSLNSYILGYNTCFTLRLKELTKSIKRNKSPSKVLRELQVLHNYWQYTIQFLFIPAFSLSWGIGVILALFGAFRYPGVTAIKTGLTGGAVMMGLNILFSSCAKLSEASDKLFLMWKRQISVSSGNRKATRIDRKVMRSIIGYRVYIGNAFFVESTTVLKVLEVVIQNAISLILL